MPQRSFSVFGVGHLPKICTPSCTARCMTMYLIYRGEKAVEVVRVTRRRRKNEKRRVETVKQEHI